MDNQIEMNESAAKPNPLGFDRYEIIGLLLLMYGWWKILDGSWVLAILLLAIGWLLAFAAGSRREAFLRIVGGISSDAFSATRSLCRSAITYIAEKGKEKPRDEPK